MNDSYYCFKQQQTFIPHLSKWVMSPLWKRIAPPVQSKMTLYKTNHSCRSFNYIAPLCIHGGLFANIYTTITITLNTHKCIYIKHDETKGVSKHTHLHTHINTDDTDTVYTQRERTHGHCQLRRRRERQYTQ